MSYNALPPTNSPSAIPQPSPTSPPPYQPPMLANRVYRDGGATPSGGRNMYDYSDEIKSSRPAPTTTPPSTRDPPNSATSNNSNMSAARNLTNSTFSNASTVVQSAHNSQNGLAAATPMPTSASGNGPPRQKLHRWRFSSRFG